MSDTVINANAAKYPQDEGVGAVTDGNETWNSAGHDMLLSVAKDSTSYARSDSELTFTNHDGTNDTVDVTAGVAYLDLSGETVQVQTSYGGDTPPNFDSALPSLPVIAVEVFATVGSFAVQSATASDVWLAYATDATVTGVDVGDIYIRSDDTGSVTAPPHPSVRIGAANPDDASADTLGPRFGSPRYGTVSFADTAEGVETITSAGGTVTLDLAQANVWELEAVDNLTIQFSNTTATPAGNAITVYVEDSDGAGPYTLTWPAGVTWHEGNVQGEVAANSNIELSFLSTDGGSTWRGRLAGEAFA